MNILVTSDWQAQASNLAQCEQAAAQMIRLIKEHKYTTVIHCGDLKEAFNPVDQRVTNFWVRFVSMLGSMGCEVIVLAGNHDRITTRDDSPSMLPVLQEAGATTAEEQQVITLGGLTIACIPHYRNPESTRNALRELPAADLLLFHCDVAEATLDCTGRKMPDGIPKKELLGFSKKFRYMVGGHVHKHQCLGPNAWYIGSPFCCDWGEVNQPKYFMGLHFEGKIARVVEHESEIPGWHDPELPNYTPPASWNGTRVRVRVQGQETSAEVRFRASQKYPGASIHVIRPEAELPTQQKISAVREEVALQEWITNNPPPVGTPQEAEQLIKRVLDLRNSGTATLSFCDLSAQNVLSYMSVDYHVAPGPKLVLVTGESKDWEGHSNGSGKTNLLSLVPVALFGCTLKGQQHDAWARDGDRRAKVSLEMSVGAIPLKVERTRNPGSLRVWVDGVEHTQGTPAQTQRYLTELIGISFEAFRNAVYIGQQEVATILTGTESARKELLGAFLGLSRFGKAVDALKAILKRGRAFYAELEAEAHETEARCQEIRERLKDLPAETLEEMLEQAEKEVRVVTQLLDALRAVEKQRKLQDAAVNQFRTSVTQFAQRTRTAEAKLCSAQERVTDLERSKCSTCGGYLKQDKAALIKAREDVATYAAALKKAQTEEKLADEQYREAFCGAEELRVAEKNASLKHGKAEASLESLVTKGKLAKRADEARKRLRDLEKFCTVAKLTKEVGAEWEARLVYCIAALSRDGFPAYLCSRALPVLNAAARKYASKFSGGAIGITFTQDEDSLQVVVNNPNGGDTIQDQSAGELQTAGLIATFALREALLPGCDLLMLDEPGNGLDAANASNFAVQLSAIAKQFGTVYVVSHNPAIIANLEADKHMHVTKQDGVSTLATQ
jgi:DNA repair exonuclease SbcCD ATPase subunit/predicted phosphodiesterase